VNRWLSDAALAHLRGLGEVPETTGTRYHIVATLGQGGMGAVYLAEDRDLDRLVALKALHPEQCDPETAERLRREARILAGLEHPGIVPVHEIGELRDGRTYYVMKYVQGVRLDDFVRNESHLPARLEIFARICDAVAFAHAHGVVHRDLKPENVMIGAFGEVLVLDWGVAKRVGGRVPDAAADAAPPAATAVAVARAAAPEPHLTQGGEILGTPAYMAPEQRRGEPVEARADVYALGVLLHFLLCEQPIAAPGMATAAARSRSRRLSAVCERATARAAVDRYPGVEALAAEVRRDAAGERVQAYPETPFERARRVASRFRAPILLVLVYLAVRTVLLVWFRR